MLIKALSEIQQKSKESQVMYQNGIFITITRNIIKNANFWRKIMLSAELKGCLTSFI